MKSDRTNYRVIKTLSPGDRGAIELARAYGERLVCVRHRTDAKGKVRHTTVELLVNSTPIQARSAKMVHIRLAPNERDLQVMVQAAGGRWDGIRNAWRIPSRVASILNLRNRIVSMTRG